MKLRYSLLVSDLDGTLLTSEHRITPRTKQIIEQYQRLGGKFTIATGRSLMESRVYIDELDLQLPVILYNGAMIYFPQEDRVQIVNTLKRRIVEALFRDIQKLNMGIEFLLFSPTQIYSYYISDQKLVRLTQLGIDPTPVDSNDQIKEEIVKMQLIGSESNVQRLHAFVKHHPLRAECDFVQSHDHYYEIIPQGVSKGNALKMVNEILQVPASNTAAIGDQCNDISMLEIVGLPATLVHAHSLVKEIAAYHVPNNDQEGVAYFIERVLLQERI